MVIKVYCMPGSPPCTSVLLTLKALNLHYERILINFQAGEHLTPDYLKKNPRHTVPTIEDGNFVLYESHAIIAYLVDKYNNGSSLYPIEVEKRAIINQIFLFNCQILYPLLRKINFQVIKTKNAIIPQEDLEEVEEAFRYIEILLEKGTKFLTSNDVTIADFSIIPSLTTLRLWKPDMENGKYPLTAAYIARCQKTMNGYDEINGDALNCFTEFFRKNCNINFSGF